MKKGDSVIQVVVTGGMTTTAGPEDPTSIVEIYDTKGDTWTAGRFTMKSCVRRSLMLVIGPVS